MHSDCGLEIQTYSQMHTALNREYSSEINRISMNVNEIQDNIFNSCILYLFF